MRTQRGPFVKALVAVFCLFSFEVGALCDEATLTGDFPFDNVKAIYSGPFTRSDRSDLLVVENVGALGFQSHRGGAGSSVTRLALYSFDGSKFQKVWEDGSLSLEYSIPRFKGTTISSQTWCYGDLDGNGRYSIVTCNVNRMQQYAFADSIFKPSKMLWPEKIRTPDSIWIDQMIACDINDDGKDEIVTLNYPDNPDSCCSYHVVIYKIEGDKPAGKRLVEIGRGPEHLGGNNGVVPPNKFISICHIEGIPGRVPVEMGSQSDMSLSSYLAIGKSDSVGYEIKRPFPKPDQLEIPKEVQKKRREIDRNLKIPRIKEESGPIGGVIFNDGDKVLHYGYFNNVDSKDPYQRMPNDQFALLENGRWRLLQKDNPDIGGLLTSFTITPDKPGWLFIKDGKYYFYDQLPVKY